MRTARRGLCCLGLGDERGGKGVNFPTHHTENRANCGQGKDRNVRHLQSRDRRGSQSGSGANGRIWPAMMSAELPEGGHGQADGCRATVRGSPL